MSHHYHSYLLRLWRNHAGVPWRLALQNTLTGEVETFTNPPALSFYLLAVMGLKEESILLTLGT